MSGREYRDKIFMSRFCVDLKVLKRVIFKMKKLKERGIL